MDGQASRPRFGTGSSYLLIRKLFFDPLIRWHRIFAPPARAERCIHALSVERDCAESQSQQHLRRAVTPNLLRLVLRTQPRSGLPAKFTDNLWMH